MFCHLDMKLAIYVILNGAGEILAYCMDGLQLLLWDSAYRAVYAAQCCGHDGTLDVPVTDD